MWSWKGLFTKRNSGSYLPRVHLAAQRFLFGKYLIHIVILLGPKSSYVRRLMSYNRVLLGFPIFIKQIVIDSTW